VTVIDRERRKRTYLATLWTPILIAVVWKDLKVLGDDLKMFVVSFVVLRKDDIQRDARWFYRMRVVVVM
jgi:hypothetical protein